MKLKIEKISRREVETKRGKSWKISVLCENEWYSAFANNWNAQWKEGQTIDVAVEDRPGNNGQVFHNIVPPKTTGGNGGFSSNATDEIKGMLIQLMAEVLVIRKALVSEPVKRKAVQADPDDNGPVPEEEHLPF